MMVCQLSGRYERAAEREVFATATDRKRRLRWRRYCRIVHYAHNTFTGFAKHFKHLTVFVTL